MRGGSIYIERDAGYRCGIHMKEYQQKVPAIVIGGWCGSFWEYLGGRHHCGAGHRLGGPLPRGGTSAARGTQWRAHYLRTTHLPPDLPAQVVAPRPRREDISHLAAPGGGVLPPLPGGEGAAARLPLLCAAAQHEKSLQAAPHVNN